jgi:integrase
MASVFKRGRDRGKRNAPYWIEFFDHEGKRRRKKGFSEKGLSEQLAAKLENEVLLRRSGMIDPFAEKLAAERQAPMEEHLKTYERNLNERGTTSKHVKLTMTRLRALVKQCKMERLTQLSVEQVQSGLAALQVQEKFGPRTYNHYVQAIVSYGHWLVETSRLAAHPLLSLKRQNVELDVRRKRRALDDQEIVKLIGSARQSGKCLQGYDGEQRARLYLFSCLTGLRKSEIASLSPQSFILKGPEPTVTVQAACSKHRRTDVLPLHPALVGEVSQWIKGLAKDQTIFPRLKNKNTCQMVKSDLERVGVPYRTSDGVADFHAAGRHTFVTQLLRSGASLPETKELARHADVKMTMRYAHINMKDQARALASLRAPSLTRVPVEQAGQHTGRTWRCRTDSAKSRHDNRRQPRRGKIFTASQIAVGSSDATGQSVAKASSSWRSPPKGREPRVNDPPERTKENQPPRHEGHKDAPSTSNASRNFALLIPSLLLLRASLEPSCLSG